ncbi:LuxR C-terminal-related transcriptional regulator [Ancylomarina longa]|uniref:LuxR family transcriptional regulator n=1 Tax=Ancylomarina longa TaxID=2487017 RepID=A0A434AGY1_9BACT|nr:LuxR C-terminal-related transcriptional regulator [Ancylomarina longa]RUT73651.1 LuxR family transcriptional regulator [Ancylomarina longa]
MNLLMKEKELCLDEILEELGIGICPKSGLPLYANNSQPLFDSMISESGSGMFIFDMDLELIVWSNDHFLELNQLKQEYFFHPAFNELINRKFHQEDSRFLNELKEKLRNKEDDSYISRIMRIKQKNGKYKYFRFVLVSAADNKNKILGKIKIGLQYDLTPILNQYQEMQESVTIVPNINTKEDFQKLYNLSKREKQILKLIVKGFTDKKIADQLHISKYTSEKHRKNIIQKLQVKNTACLSFIAGKYGIF